MDLLTIARIFAVITRLVSLTLIFAFVFPQMIDEAKVRDKYYTVRISLPLLMIFYIMSTSLIAYYNYCSQFSCNIVLSDIQPIVSIFSGLSAVLTGVMWVLIYHTQE